MRKPFKKVVSESKAKQQRRKLSIRSKLSGTSERPRLCAIKSNKHIQVQVVDDFVGKTLFSVQTFGKNRVDARANVEGAAQLGKVVADKLKESKIETAVFDRNGNIYTGVLKSLADSIRENGINV